MKLSEMTTDKLADVLCEIAEPMERISADEKFISKLQKYAKLEKNKTTRMAVLAEMLSAITELLRADLRADTYRVLAVLNGKTAEEIAAQKPGQTVEDIKGVFESDIMDFFK